MTRYGYIWGLHQATIKIKSELIRIKIRETLLDKQAKIVIYNLGKIYMYINTYPMYVSQEVFAQATIQCIIKKNSADILLMIQRKKNGIL
jgi:hypothetical protein